MGYIKKDFIEKLLDRAILQDVIGKFVKLDRAGANFKAKSPWSDDRTASLMVSPVKEIWKDFSTGKGGNMVNFVMEHESCSYPEAIEKIAGIYNEAVEYEAGEFSEKKKEALERKEVLRKVLKAVHELYQKEYNALPAEHNAKKEVEIHRQYDADIILEWGICFAPDNFLYNKFSSSGKVSIGEDLGLIVKQWDRYSNKVVYPIHDANGLLIGFGGRDVSGKPNQAKWINPPVNLENLLYNKSKVWYGLHKAKMAIRKRREAFIVEGYNDVIAWHLFGLENTVAPCGTAITKEQINILKKLCDKVVFCMDPDKAGKAAVLKQIPEFIQEGFRTEVIFLDLDPDDFGREYHEVIVLSEGLDNMFKEPGVRIDGFKLLVNEFIKKDYYELEESLEKERLRLSEMLSDFELEKATLTADKVILEGDYLTADNLLKEIALISKKTDDYKEQQKTTTTLKGLLDKKKHELKNHIESVELKQQKNLVGILSKQYDQVYKASEISRASGAKELCKIVISIEDDALLQIYMNWIQAESKITKSTLNAWIKELRNEADEEEETYIEYQLPKEVAAKFTFKDFEKSIKHYGMFMALNQIYMALPEGRDRVVNFSSISNFMIEILQHMNDEKYPAKLIRIVNVHGKEIIFDTLSDNLNSPQIFYNTMSSHGNFNFKGSNSDLGSLRTYLFDNMGNGRKIEVLGWQPDGNFWSWNNRIITEEGVDVPLDENGVFVHKDTHYYIPSANKIHKFSSNKFNSQKRFKVMENALSFEVYMAKVLKVHREAAISGLLFGIASLFQDIAVDENGNFPLLFLYGPGGTGKDELAYIVQSFTGMPQIPINLEGGASTLKAKIIELAQFKNGISQLSEYKRGDDKVDGTLKAIWDRVGYKRGSIESRIAIDTVDIESSVILTGNDFPPKEPNIIRLIWIEMNKSVFNQDEMKEFDELNDMTQQGLSGYSHKILSYRKVYKENFSKKYRFWKGFLQDYFPEAKGRIISNLAVLGSTYEIIRDNTDIVFPFSQNDMIDHFRRSIDHQVAKINSASIMVRFWDCFIVSLRGNKEERIQVNHIVNIEGNILYVQWTHVYAKIERQWWLQYKEAAPNKNTVKEELQKAGMLVEEKGSHSFDKGREANRTSAYGINLLKLSANQKEDVVGSIMFQTNENSLFPEEDVFQKKKASEAITQTAIALENIGNGTDEHFL